MRWMYFCGTFRLSNEEITPIEGVGRRCGDDETHGAAVPEGAEGSGTASDAGGAGETDGMDGS